MTTTRQSSPGSSWLADEDRVVYEERFGARYTHVQQQPQTASRRERRRRDRKQRKSNEGREKE